MLLDLTRAQEFALDPQQLRELVMTFEQSLSQEMAVIQTALAQHEALKVEHSLHALKGFMALFTGEDLAQRVTTLYQSSRSQPLDVTRAEFTALVPTLSALLTEVRAWLGPL